MKKGVALSVTGRTADEAKRLLEDKLKLILEAESVSLIVSPITPLEDHKCTLSRPAEV